MIAFIAVGLLLSAHAYALDVITIELGGTPVVLSVSPTNKALLVRLLVRENVRRSGLNTPLPVLTLEEFVRNLFVDTVREQKTQAESLDYSDACTVFKTLSNAAQAGIITQLGGTSPCP